MTAVFVHGSPETSAVWQRLRSELTVDSIALGLPGFGTPRPSGFGATKDEYVDWVLAELERLEPPIDLVGHDWGALLTYRIATAFGDGVRSWVADVGFVFHPDYVWHDAAQAFHSGVEREEHLAQLRNIRPWLIAAGAPESDAEAIAAAVLDETMQRSIVDVYSSAFPNTFADWGRDVNGPTVAPGLILIADAFEVEDPARSREVADMLGARLEILAGLGHWWMLESPATTAATLERFWASVG